MSLARTIMGWLVRISSDKLGDGAEVLRRLAETIDPSEETEQQVEPETREPEDETVTTEAREMIVHVLEGDLPPGVLTGEPEVRIRR